MAEPNQPSLYKVLKPTSGLRAIDIKEIIRYKDLLYFFVLKDITVLYKQTVMGFSWAIINPVFTMLIMTVVFGTVAGVETDGIPHPIFTLAAVLPWNYFSSSFTASTNSLVANKAIFTKVYFPRLIIPIVPAFSKMVDFLIAFVILIGMMVYYQYLPGLGFLLLIPLLILLILFTVGLGMWLSALAIQYRDIKFGVTFITPLLMYVAPVGFSATEILDKFGQTAYYTYSIFPMVGIIEGFRAAIFGSPMPWDILGIGAIVSLILFVTGMFYFTKMEKHFADVA